MCTRLAVRSMEPSRMPSTLSSRAMSGRGRLTPFVLHRRSAGDDAEAAVLCQYSDEFVGHAVGEVVLGGVAREVGQRNYRDGVDLGSLIGADDAMTLGGDENGGYDEAEGDDDGEFGSVALNRWHDCRNRSAVRYVGAGRARLSFR